MYTLLQMKDELERDDSRANEEYKEDIQVHTHWAMMQPFFPAGGGEVYDIIVDSQCYFLREGSC
jgi:hypothetical protein